jgi:protein TonB
MNRLNLLLGAILSLTLIAGVAYYGEITGHFHPLPARPPGPTPTPTPFVLNPDPVEVTDPTDARPQAKEDVASPPVNQDYPQPAPPDRFTVPVEPPPPAPFDPNLTKIPQGPRGTGLTPRIWDPGQLEQPPIARVKIPPVYPQELKRQGITGEVLVDFIVDPSGNVRNPVAARSSQRDFEESACRAVGKWRFTPGIKGGRAVFVHMQVPIVFTLSDGD